MIQSQVLFTRLACSRTFARVVPGPHQVRDPAATTPQPDMFLIHEKGKWCITFYVKTTQTMAGMGCFDQDVFNPGDITEPLMIAGAADVNTKVACRKFAFATEEGPVHNEL